MFQPTKAPYIRPGVVIHEANSPVDTLLAEFALSLRERGFSIAGCVERDGRIIDLASAQLTPADDDSRRAASRVFRAAMRDDVDLVVVGGFSDFAAAAKEMMATVSNGQTTAMPALTSLPGGDIQHWLNFAGQAGSMITPGMEALWHWWGPERIYRDLALGVAEDEVRDITCGPRWLMITGPHGAGLAYLPRSSKELIPRLGDLKRKSLHRLAELSGSWDPLEMAVGIAAINAHYNRFDQGGEMGNGAESFRDENGRVVVIGAFPGLAETLANPQVIEVEPRPGEFPVVAMDTLLPGCAAAVVASSTIVNRTLPRILRLSHGSRVAVVGPITPMTPRLFHYGVHVLGGLVVRDAPGLAAAIRAGAMPREFPRFGQYRHITRHP